MFEWLFGKSSTQQIIDTIRARGAWVVMDCLSCSRPFTVRETDAARPLVCPFGCRKES